MNSRAIGHLAETARADGSGLGCVLIGYVLVLVGVVMMVRSVLS